MSTADETLATFLGTVWADARARFGEGPDTHTRTDLIGLFQTVLPDGTNFSQVLDLAFYYGLMDAHSKNSATYDGYFITDQGLDFIRSPGSAVSINELLSEASTTLVDSSVWTGLPKSGVLSEGARTRLKVALKLLDNGVEEFEATNEERAQARAYLLALHAFTDAPEPPAELIWKIITVAAALSGIGQLFVAILDLYK
ncbi:MAG: hypothetical protein K2X68_08010 [Novosphingobium sp.]|nr:hypothetical protein [Novosphingobium sp.]